MENYYENYAQKILADLGFSKLPEEKKKEILEMIKKRTDQKILLTIMANLKDNDIGELNSLTEQETPVEEIIKFMSSRIENLDDKITKALGELYEQMVTDIKQIAQAAQKA